MSRKHFTTIEQSKTLLELGVPVRSADCYYPIINAQIMDYIEVIYDKEVFFDDFIYLKDFIPCWSVGELMYITQSYRKPNALGSQWYDLSLTDGWDYVKLFVNQIRIDVKNKIFDISKIE